MKILNVLVRNKIRIILTETHIFLTNMETWHSNCALPQTQEILIGCTLECPEDDWIIPELDNQTLRIDRIFTIAKMTPEQKKALLNLVM
jgi:hypothetical protein